MYKKIIMFITILSVLFLFEENVYAEGATCVYKATTANTSINFTIVCKATEDSVDCSIKENTSGYVSVDKSTSTLAPVNFQSNKKWKCPSNIYGKYTGGSASSPSTKFQYLSATKTEKATDSYSIISNDSSDGEALSDDSPVGEESSFSCKYGDLIITSANGKISDNNPCASTTTINIDAKYFASSCLSQVWVYSYKGHCTYTKDKGTSGGWIKLDSDTPIPDADGNDNNGGSDNDGSDTTTTTSGTRGCDILGGVNSKTVGLLSDVVKIIRLGVPVLIIILGITDFMKILFSGEDKVFKDAFSKFAKRLGIGVIIIFIPYILQAVIKLTGIETQYGIDNFFCGIVDATSSSSNKKTCSDYDFKDCPTTAENGKSCQVIYDKWDTEKESGSCSVKK